MIGFLAASVKIENFVANACTMRYLILLVLTSACFGQSLTSTQAAHLAGLPIRCLQQEYPNKTGQLLANSSEIAGPKTLHPAFYGCFDWHSSVHGHWSLVYLLGHFPELEGRENIIAKLQQNLSRGNIDAEIAYLSKKHEKSFERTYGWAWLLKLQQELDTSPDSYAPALAANLRPLTDTLVARYTEFLPKLLYPIRVGTHSNTAFGLSLALDYAEHTGNTAFQSVLRTAALRLFGADKNGPFAWEPSGTDFLSPCLEEIGIMQRVLPRSEFLKWMKHFAPHLKKKNFDWEPGKVSDRTDGHLVHLDGLNFSRAWNLYRLAAEYPREYGHLKALADVHMAASLSSVVDGNYEGEHWLASFALHAYEEKARTF